MITIIEVTLGEEILEECIIIEVKISEVDIEVTIQNEDFRRGRYRERQYSSTLEETIKAVVDQDQA